MRSLLALSCVALLAGCASPITGEDATVSGYVVSRDSDLQTALPGGASNTVTCTGGKNVHRVTVSDASSWTLRSEWRVFAGDQATLAIELDAVESTVHVSGCLAPGETVTRMRYARGSEVLATAIVDIEPTTVA